MPTEKKLFIATSSFGKDKPELLSVLKKKKIKFSLNKLKRKLKSKELVFYAKNYTHIIAGTQTYDKNTLTKLKNLKIIYRLGVGTHNIALQQTQKNKVRVFRLPVQSKNPILMIINSLIITLIVLIYNINIVHARSRAPAWSCYWSCFITRRKFVTTFHGTYNFKNSYKKFYNSVIGQIKFDYRGFKLYI